MCPDDGAVQMVSEQRTAVPDIDAGPADAWRLPLVEHFQEFWRYRGLLWSWMIRDIKIKYEQTVLGVAWAVLQPLLMMVVMTILFSRVARLPSDGIPYPLFVYSALVPWTFFATSVSLASMSLVTNMNLVTKIYFPREILPFASVGGCLIDFLIAGLTFAMMMAYYGLNITPRVLLLPLLLAVQFLLTLGIALLTAAACVYFRDVKYALPFALQLWMFGTPVVYPLSAIPDRYQALYLCLNPLSGLIEGYRRVLLWQAPPPLAPIYIGAFVALAFFVLAYAIFKRTEVHFADII